MRVLIVDDNELAIAIIKDALTAAGYDVLCATDGNQALRYLRDGACRLVVSDWRMPGMSGPELCKIVRAEKLPGYIYFILLTAYDGAQQKIDGLAAGADDFIAKPFDAPELVARVRAGERILTADRAELQAEITLRRLAEKDLLKHRQNLERANVELKNSNQKFSALYQTAQRFVDNVSHEFRTPLTVIKGYAEAISDEMAGPLNATQKEFLGFVVDRTRDLAQMVDDLLDSSKIRAGTLRIDRAAHSIEQILAPVRPMLQAKAAGNRITLVESIPASLPTVFADAEKAGRVIVNLVVNAIKFSPENSNVTLWALPEDGGVELGITDHGPGISPENLQAIFQRFKQFGNPQDSTKGFGLGLNIARELVMLNLGEIRVTSSRGQGSTFSFTLPPDNPAAILRRYLNYLRQAARSESHIGALRVQFSNEKPVDENLRRFIASAIHPTDLALPGQEHFLVVGCTGEVEQWASRLRAEFDAFTARVGPAQSLPSLIIETVGEWPYPPADESLEDVLLHEFNAEVIHA